jgi:hypothetical protein
MLKALKKFSLLILTICMVVGLLPTTTYAATAKDEFIYDFTEAFAGHWYNAAGQQMLSITRNEINGCFIMETLDQVGAMPGSGTFRVVNGRHFQDVHLAWSAPSASKISYLVLNGQALHRHGYDNLPYENVNGVGLSMTQAQVTATLGAPTQVLALAEAQKYKVPVGSWLYAQDGLIIEFTGAPYEVSGILLLKNSKLKFTNSKLGPKDSLAKYAKAYGLKSIAPKGGAPYSIGNGQYLGFNDYPQSVLLTIFNT